MNPCVLCKGLHDICSKILKCKHCSYSAGGVIGLLKINGMHCTVNKYYKKLKKIWV